MSRQYFSETIKWITADGTPVTNTTTETIIVPNTTIPANTMQDGRALRLRAIGRWSTGTGPPTLTFRVRWGGVAGTVLAASAAVTLVVSTTAAQWDLDLIIQNRSNGAAATMFAQGTLRVFAGVAGTVASATGEGLVTPMGSAGVLAPAVSAGVDATADAALSLTAQWSVASTSHTITTHIFTLESLN